MVRQRHPEGACLSREARDRAQWASSVQALWEERPSEGQCCCAGAHPQQRTLDEKVMLRD